MATLIMSLNGEFIFFGVNEKQVSRVAILDFRIANLKLLRELVSSVLWESDFQGLEIHDSWSIFKNNLSEAQEQAITLCRTSCNRGRRAENRELLLELMKKKNYMISVNTVRLHRMITELWFPMSRQKAQKSKTQS